MPAIVLQCPQCAAMLKATDGATIATCEYCGATSQIQQRSRIFQIPLPMTSGLSHPVVRSPVNKWMLLPLVIVPIMFPIIIMVAVHHHLSKFVYPKNVGAALTAPMASWNGGGAPVFADVNGDGVPDVIGKIRYINPHDVMHLAAYSGVGGKELWETAALGTYHDIYQGHVTVAGDKVLMSTSAGAVRAFSLKSGLPAWEAELGDTVETWCRGSSDANVVIATHDGKFHQLELSTGKHREVDAQKRGNWQDKAKSYKQDCAIIDDDSTHVTPGITIREKNTDGLPTVDGVALHYVASRGDFTFAVGERVPGTQVPMLARVDSDGKTLWKVQIPSVNPLTASSPDNFIAITDTLVAMVYYDSGLSSPHVTAFALDDGRRLWDTPFGKKSPVLEALASSGKWIWLSEWGHLHGYDPATGREQIVIGETP